MGILESFIEFLKLHWLTVVLIVTAWTMFLISFAQLRVDLAKTTPDKKDDQEAKLFSKKVKAFVKFFKSLFGIKDNADKK